VIPSILLERELKSTRERRAPPHPVYHKEAKSPVPAPQARGNQQLFRPSDARIRTELGATPYDHIDGGHREPNREPKTASSSGCTSADQGPRGTKPYRPHGGEARPQLDRFRGRDPPLMVPPQQLSPRRNQPLDSRVVFSLLRTQCESVI